MMFRKEVHWEKMTILEWGSLRVALMMDIIASVLEDWVSTSMVDSSSSSMAGWTRESLSAMGLRHIGHLCWSSIVFLARVSLLARCVKKSG